jgi:DNA-binding transcriptional MocR family regulator
VSKNYVKAVLDDLSSLRNPIDTLVLLAIAEYTSDDTRLAWPSVRTLCRRTRLSRRTLQRSLRSLEHAHLISTTLGGQSPDHGVNTSSCYRLEFDHRGALLEAKAPPKKVLKPIAASPATSDEQRSVSHAESKAALDNIYRRLGRRRAE